MVSPSCRLTPDRVPTTAPVKFSETVEGAINKNLNLLEGYDSLFECKEKYVELRNDVNDVIDQILTKN